ncbi:transposase [Lactobacillus delbrueckii subsp. bulgaricus]|nr:transposase [Lactobacillus delbrueckii]RXS37506.1 hypothetical protein EST31_09920 [Lactobacillus delbrueckii subsp. bulgaricus]MCD5440617.1 transposase [Lactobacillus delbrueckii subsp. lactis]MCD5540909.1 transposase [Lactobacillus delbrueckii subsp. lactis]MCD5545188.1 transposase [Lactobacillus delbrueckii subsp. lactis]MCD5548812.1 transposase [Lactobacillus delbrueckii subsp. lactis]
MPDIVQKITKIADLVIFFIFSFLTLMPMQPANLGIFSQKAPEPAACQAQTKPSLPRYCPNTYMKGAKQHNKREIMAIRRTIESVFSVLKYYGIENILARSIVGFQQTVELIVLTYNISYILQRYEFNFFN